jgi:aspartyl/asparaginyl beta-hydroxylase (cupin superfamily)
LLKSMPEVLAAMFSILPPGKEIPPHIGPFRGSLRYHLGLKVPRDRQNCYINVDGRDYHWREGEGQLFDDTYLHHVRNDTNETRIVLFLDVERPLKSALATRIHQTVLRSPLPRWLSIMNNKQETAKSIGNANANATATAATNDAHEQQHPFSE